MLRRPLGLALSFLLILAALASFPTRADAAPPTATWSGTGAGSVAELDVTAIGVLNLAGLDIAQSEVATGSQLTPRSTAQSQNVSAAVAGLPITVQSTSQIAPPDNPDGAVTNTLLGITSGLVNVGAITTANEAHWSGDSQCVATARPLASSSTGTAGLDVNLLSVELVDLGTASTSTTSRLAPTTGLNRGVSTTTTGDLASLTLVNDLIGIDVGTPTLTATSYGGVQPSVATYTPDTITITSPGRTDVLSPGGSLTLNAVGGLANVIITANEAVTTPGATSASASVSSVLTVQVSLLSGLASVTLDVLPLSANSSAPTGGIDCPPPAPVVAQPADGSLTNDTTPTFSGNGYPGATVNLTVDGTTTTNVATVSDEGTWTFTPTAILAEGDHTVSATQTLNGTTSAVSATNTFTVDSVAPAAPVVTTPANGSLTADNTPTYAGTAVGGSTVTVLVDGTPIGTTTATGGGTWSLVQPTALVDGSHTVSATATDAAGNTSVSSNTNTFTVDATAPGAPVITVPVDGTRTNDQTPTVSGTAADGATAVTLTVNGTTYGPLPVTGGTWSTTLPTLPAGDYTATATSTDAAGNVSPVSAEVDFTIDLVAAAPVITTPVDGSVTNDTTPTVAGTAEPGASVVVTINGTAYPAVVADDDGNWTLDVSPALVEGDYTATAVQTDVATNVSAPSAPVTFAVDLTAPAAPVITEPADDTVTNVNTPTIAGTAELGSETVTVTLTPVGGGAAIVIADVPVTGTTWTTTSPALADGDYVITAVATDPAGNDSPASVGIDLTVDTVAAPPVILTPTDGTETTDTTPTITGTAEPGAAVIVTVGGTEYGPVTADEDGDWELTVDPALTDGTYPITAVQTDVAGNESDPSAAVELIIDTTAPVAPVITAPVDESVTDQTSVDISGTAEADSEVVVTLTPTTGAPIVLPAVTATGGTFTVTATGLADGTYAATAIATDAAGNDSLVSNTVDFTVDTEDPIAPTIVDPTEGERINDPTPAITGTSEPNASVVVTVDGVDYPAVIADELGNWTLPATATLAEGSHTVSAVATDAAGNTSPSSVEVTFIVDLTATEAPVITTPVNNARTNDTTPTIAGTAPSDAVSVTVTVSGVEYGPTPVTAGVWTLDVSPALVDGFYTATAVATDAAGNVSAPSNSAQFTVDTVAPQPPTIFQPANGSTTTERRPLIFGFTNSLEFVPGSVVTIYIDGAIAGTATADIFLGPFFFNPTTDLADGIHTVYATQTDAAGNVSPASNTNTFIVDSEVPLAPVIDEPADGSSTNDTTPTFSGTSEGLVNVELYLDGVLLTPTPQATPLGTWSYTPTTPLPDGEYDLVAVAVDGAGNRSVNSNEVTFTIDTVAAPVPVITDPVDGAQLDASPPTVSGTASGDAVSVVVTIGATTYGPVPVTAGAWSVDITPALADGDYTATAVATDAAGNPSAPSEAVDFTVDTVAPEAPVITAPVDGAELNDTTPTISGTAPLDAESVTVTIGGTTYGPTPVVNGAWTLDVSPALAEGDYTATAVATDEAGNVSGPSEAVDFTVDTTAPEAPVITSPVDGDEINDTTPDIVGTAEPGASVVVTIGGTTYGPVTADDEGDWTLTVDPALVAGDYTATAVATDEAGNASGPSGEVDFTIDLTAPAAPIITSPSAGDVLTGPDVEVVGTAEPGTEVTVSIDGEEVDTVIVDEDGNWTVTIPDVAPGDHTVDAVATDEAGNESEPDTVDFTLIDTVAPEVTITSPLDGSTIGELATITGTSEPGATVVVSVDGQVVGTVVTDEDGQWSLELDDPLPFGDHVISAVATDQVGNTGEPAEVAVTVADIVSPVITDPVDDEEVTTRRPVISGTGEPGAAITVTVTGQDTATRFSLLALGTGEVVGTTVVDEDGTWLVTPVDDFALGRHQVEARQEVPQYLDRTSNLGSFVVVTADVDEPTRPVITDPSPGDEVEAGPVTVCGTGEPGATINLYDSVPGQQASRIVGTTVVALDGTWCIEVVLDVDDHSLIVEQLLPDGTTQLSDRVDITVVRADNGSGGNGNGSNGNGSNGNGNGSNGSGNGNGNGGLAGTGGPSAGLFAAGLLALLLGAAALGGRPLVGAVGRRRDGRG